VDSRPPASTPSYSVSISSASRSFFIATQALRALSASIDRLVPRSFPVPCRSCVPSHARARDVNRRPFAVPASQLLRPFYSLRLRNISRQIKRSGWSAAHKGGELSLSVCSGPPRRRPQRELYTYSSRFVLSSLFLSPPLASSLLSLRLSRPRLFSLSANGSRPSSSLANYR